MRRAGNGTGMKPDVESMDLALDDGFVIPVSIRRSTRARRILVHVGSYDGKVEVVLPPGCSTREGVGFATSQAGWIARQLSRIDAPVPFADGADIPLLGETVTIRLVPGASAVPHLGLGELLVGGSDDTLPGRVRRWLRTEARSRIEPLAREMAQTVGRTVNRVTVRDTRSRWGSCSRAGNLNFSWRLVMAPEAVLEYVVAHEVAHLVEMNHSPAFWSVVADLCPGHRKSRQWLRAHGAGLHRYGREIPLT